MRDLGSVVNRILFLSVWFQGCESVSVSQLALDLHNNNTRQGRGRKMSVELLVEDYFVITVLNVWRINNERQLKLEYLVESQHGFARVYSCVTNSAQVDIPTPPWHLYRSYFQRLSECKQRLV